MKTKSITSKGWLGWDGLFLALWAFLFVVLVTGAGDGTWARKCRDVNSIETPGVDQESGIGDRSLDEKKRSPDNIDNTIGMRKKILGLIPTALIVFVVGVVIAICRNTRLVRGFKYGPQHIFAVHISRHDWKTGFVRAAVPQIPLSLLNAVIAICKLSNDLFPEKKLVTTRTVSTSVGLMNLVGCWFGAMPVCHGTGGLAGQYKFGATSGLSVAILGTAKLIVGLVFGSSLLRLLGQFPVELLGVLLFFSRLELAIACRDQNSRFDAFNMLVVTIMTLGSNSAAKEFVFGLIIWALAKLHPLFTESRPITDFLK